MSLFNIDPDYNYEDILKDLEYVSSFKMLLDGGVFVFKCENKELYSLLLKYKNEHNKMLFEFFESPSKKTFKDFLTIIQTLSDLKTHSMAQTISHFVLLAIYRFVQVHKDIFGNIDFHQQILIEHKENNLNLTNIIEQLEKEKKQFYAALALKEEILSLEKEKVGKLSEQIEILTIENKQLIQKCQRIIDDDDNYFLENKDDNEKFIIDDLKMENLELIKKCESLMTTSAETALFIDNLSKERENLILENKNKNKLLEEEKLRTQNLEHKIKRLENDLEKTKKDLEKTNKDKEEYFLSHKNIPTIPIIKQTLTTIGKANKEYSYREKRLFLKYLREEVLFENNVNYNQFDFSSAEIIDYEIFRDGFLKSNNRYVYLDNKMYKLGLEDQNKSLREKADIRNHIGFDLYCL